MAKGKDMSKGQKAANKEKMVVDKTFGMKNKNKSKKVQKYVQQVQQAAANKFVDKKAEKAKSEATLRKEAKKQHEAEIAALFNSAPEKKVAKKKQDEEDAPPEEEEVDNTEAWLAEMGIEIEQPQVDGRRKAARARRSADANQAEEERLQKIAERDGKTVEEKLEIVRKSLALDVPVNKESFLEWKAVRDIKRAEERAEAVTKAQKGTKKGGKSQLTGRQLFEFHADIFVDDAEAGDADQYSREFDDAEAANAALEAGAGAEAEAAPSEAPAANATAEAPASNLEGVDESVFLAEDLDGLDDLPSDDDE